MLMKLFKYEMKSTARSFLPCYAVLLVTSVLCRIFTSISSDVAIVQMLKGILMFTQGGAITAVAVLTFLIMVQRFYKNLFGDEGYLMHTLPMAPWKQVVNKVLATLVWLVASGCIITAATLIAYADGSMLQAFLHIPENFFAGIDTESAFFVIEFGILAFLGVCHAILMVYASISIGHLAARHKMLCSFAAFIGLSIAMQIITVTLALSAAGNIVSVQNVHTAFGALILYMAAFDAAYFVICNWVLQRRLNLE